MFNLLSRLAATALLALLAAAPATAAPASPADGGDVPAQLPAPVLFTSLFALTADISGIGLGANELAAVGPAAMTLETDGDNLLIVDDGTDCPNAEYPTIQSAVAAADPGDRIKVCPGLYVEEVIVPAGKDGIDLFSEGHLQAVIKAPPAFVDPARSIVTVRAQDVKLSHFTITGPGGTPCGSIVAGVSVLGGGSATIEHNHITLIRDLVFSGCQNGLGVLVGRGSQGQVGRAEVGHNLIDHYQKGGVVVDNAGSYANVHHNEITGPGLQPTIAPNGVQVSRGAGADVDHNEISENSYAFASAAGTGVLLYRLAPGLVRVGYNDVFLNDDGIGLYETEGSLVEHNYSHDQRAFDGIFVDSASAENRIEYNRMERNLEHDCHDNSVGAGTAGTANYWIKDHGLTENRPGLCKH